MKIPVIINNRDLLTWTSNMLAKIKQLNSVGEIYIVDNGSTYQPLLDWYDTNPCNIIRVENLGQHAPWICGLVDKIGIPYVVTDSDLDISELPLDTLEVLLDKLSKHTSIGKVGLKLDWHSITQDSPYYDHLNSYEKNRWETSPVIDGIHIGVHIDTTFAMYAVSKNFIGGGSLVEPYIAKHIPWSYTTQARINDADFSYYIANASTASTYKTHLNIMSLTEIANKHRVDKGTEHYEAHGYTEIYQQYINNHDTYNLLEIGIWHCDSIRMFNEYNSNINYFGIDIDPTVGSHLFGGEQCKIFIGNQSDGEFLEHVLNSVGDLDVVIDDGSHNHDDILNTFVKVAPRLKSGSIYFIEDLHAGHAKRAQLVCNLMLAISQLNLKISECKSFCNEKLLMFKICD